MNPTDAARRLLLRATNDGSWTVWDSAVDQTMHSTSGAVTEARHVYLEASGVGDRLRAGRPTTVAEVGLGSGLNLLLTADLAHTCGTTLTYRALDRSVPDRAVLASLAWDRWLEHPELGEAWLEAAGVLASTPPKPDGLVTFTISTHVILEVAWGDAFRSRRPRDDRSRDDAPDASPTSHVLRPRSAHAVYHDAYSPEVHPDAWTPEFLATCVTALVPGGSWVSYSVAGAVQRALRATGAAVAKVPGPPGGKREILVATRTVTPKEEASDPTASPTQ